MDFSQMTDDEFANAARAFFDNLHARIDAKADGPFKALAVKFANRSHGAMSALHVAALSAGVIQPMSGGDPKPS